MRLGLLATQTCLMCVIVCSKVPCGIFFKTNTDYVDIRCYSSKLIIYPLVLTNKLNAFLLPCLCWIIVAYIGILLPPVNQWNNVNPLAEFCITSPACACASLRA